MFVDTQKRPQGEQVDAIAPSRMKLSAAIRIGAKLRPQCQGDWFRDGMSCTYGAAAEAYWGVTSSGALYAKFKIAEPYYRLISELTGLPSGERFDNLVSAIWRKNDGGESRESIATWLESQGL